MRVRSKNKETLAGWLMCALLDCSGVLSVFIVIIITPFVCCLPELEAGMCKNSLLRNSDVLMAFDCDMAHNITGHRKNETRLGWQNDGKNRAAYA